MKNATKGSANALTKRDYEFLAAFRAAVRRFSRFSEEGARALGVPPQQHQVLLCIMGTPGRDWASIGEIAEFLQVRHHTAVGLIDRCVAGELVVRRASAKDRRQVQVVLTPYGNQVLETLSARNLRELQTLRKFLRPSILEPSKDED